MYACRGALPRAVVEVRLKHGLLYDRAEERSWQASYEGKSGAKKRSGNHANPADMRFVLGGN